MRWLPCRGLLLLQLLHLLLMLLLLLLRLRGAEIK